MYASVRFAATKRVLRDERIRCRPAKRTKQRGRNPERSGQPKGRIRRKKNGTKHVPPSRGGSQRTRYDPSGASLLLPPDKSEGGSPSGVDFHRINREIRRKEIQRDVKIWISVFFLIFLHIENVYKRSCLRPQGPPSRKAGGTAAETRPGKRCFVDGRLFERPADVLPVRGERREAAANRR